MNIEYDILGFPVFKYEIKFEFVLSKELIEADDNEKFKKAIKELKSNLQKGIIKKELFTPQQLNQIQNECFAVKGLRWHFHQVEGKLQLVNSAVHDLYLHVAGRELWGGGI